jgi:signal transduction histidine kinase
LDVVVVRVPDGVARLALDGIEAERRRIASDLHDTAAQALAVVRLSLELAIRGGDDGATVRIGEALPIIDHAISQVREIIFGLRPPLLEELGLAAALRWSLVHLAGATGLATDLRVDEGVADLTAEAELASYRIVQEAVANAVRHAHASQVTVRLIRAPGHVRLEVQDNGIGMPGLCIEPGEPAPTLGIRGMAERAAALGGSLRIVSRPGRGTRVIAMIPARRRSPG